MRAVRRSPTSTGWGVAAIASILASLSACGPATPPAASATSRLGSASPAAPKANPFLDLSAPSAERPEAPTSTIRFEDMTPTSGITFLHQSGNSRDKHFPTANGSGVAMIDFDRDGKLDLYFATTRNLPLEAPTTSRGNRLYRNLGDFRFEDVTERAGVGFRGFTHGVAVGDVNNDGYDDLFLCNFGPNVLYLNNGDGTFRDATAGAGLEGPKWSTAAAFFDYDGDGLLDLYVSCYGKWEFHAKHEYCGNKENRTYCSPLSIPPTRHYLFRNLGGGRFEDATEKAGILRADGRGMGVLAVDVNNDGKIDLYVANDLCPKFLFLNKGDGTFEDISEVSGAAMSESGANQAGMGLDAEDVDGDGRLDLFATHFSADYNTLYKNLTGRDFQDISASAGYVRDCMPDVGWGCSLADFDSDGWPDMFVVNGHIEDNLPLFGQDVPQAQPVKVWRNQGNAKFKLVRDPGPFFATPRVARGAAFGDLDNDGDTDVVISRMDKLPAVLKNVSENGNWVGLELISRHAPRPAIGAAVVVHLESRTLHRQVKGGGSYASANDARLSFGLGKADRVDKVEIRWPGGTRTVLVDPQTGRYHRLVEPQGAARSGSGDSGAAP